MKEIVKIGSKYTPFFVKQFIGKIVNIPIAHNTVYRHYLRKYGQARLLFNNGERRMGYLTIGYDAKCDIQLEQNKNIKLYFPAESISEIEIDRFLESIQEDSVYEDFVSECSRLLNNKGFLKITFLDSKELMKNLSDKKLSQEYWTSKRRYLYSPLISQLNYIYRGKDHQINRFLDLKTVEDLLKTNGLNVDKFNHIKAPGICDIYASKNIFRAKALSLANLLPRESEIKNDLPVYLFNCDSIRVLNNFKNINTKKLEGRKFASVIGSLFFLNLLPELKPSEVLLFDSNQYQIRYLKMLVEIFKISGTFNKFIENLFVRKYKSSPHQFLSQKPDVKIYKKLENIVSDKEIFDNTIKKIAYAKYVKINGELPALKIDGNSMCQSITILDEELFKPGPAVNVVYINSNFAKNYKFVKNLVISAQIKHLNLESKEVADYIKDNGILYVSNIGEEDWLYDDSMDKDYQIFEDRANELELSRSFREQWKNSFIGFKNFMENVSGFFWIIDSLGNIFSSQQLLLERSDSHGWLWGLLKPLIKGKAIEIIHKSSGRWGFKEYLETMNIDKYVNSRNDFGADTVVFHILLGNDVSRERFLQALKKASETAKRLIIIEHDRDSVNFGRYSPSGFVDIRDLIGLITSVKTLKEGKVTVTWSGASRRVDKKEFGNSENYRRNIIVTIDL